MNISSRCKPMVALLSVKGCSCMFLPISICISTLYTSLLHRRMVVTSSTATTFGPQHRDAWQSHLHLRAAISCMFVYVCWPIPFQALSWGKLCKKLLISDPLFFFDRKVTVHKWSQNSSKFLWPLRGWEFGWEELLGATGPRANQAWIQYLPCGSRSFWSAASKTLGSLPARTPNQIRDFYDKLHHVVNCHTTSNLLFLLTSKKELEKNWRKLKKSKKHIPPPNFPHLLWLSALHLQAPSRAASVSAPAAEELDEVLELHGAREELTEINLILGSWRETCGKIGKANRMNFWDRLCWSFAELSLERFENIWK